MRQLALIPLLLILVSCSRAPGAVGLGGGTGDPGVRTTSNSTTAIQREIKVKEEIEAGIDQRSDALDKAVDFEPGDAPVSDQDDKPTDAPADTDDSERDKAIDDLLDDINSDSSTEDSNSSSF